MNATLERVRRTVGWPFATPLAAPAWLAIRIYLGIVWIRFGWGKISDGWFESNPMGALLGAIADGATAAPVEAYRGVAGVLADLGPMLSIAIPLAEVAFAIAFFSGLLVGPAAIAATILNLNLILAGVASIEFDGRIIALQLLLAAAWHTSGYLGLGDSLRRLREDYRHAMEAVGT